MHRAAVSIQRLCFQDTKEYLRLQPSSNIARVLVLLIRNLALVIEALVAELLELRLRVLLGLLGDLQGEGYKSADVSHKEGF